MNSVAVTNCWKISRIHTTASYFVWSSYSSEPLPWFQIWFLEPILHCGKEKKSHGWRSRERSFWTSSVVPDMIPWNDSSLWKREKVTRMEISWGSRVFLNLGQFSTQIRRRKTPCLRAPCHGAGSTSQRTILSSHDEPAFSNVTKLSDNILVDNLTRWDKLSIHYHLSVEETC
jgi:hypothetical protein